MYFANPWGLLGLVAVPAIIAIHLFHQRFPPLLVGGAHLWGLETRVTTAGRRKDRVPVTLSLILELLAALLLTLALSEPRIGDTDEVAHVIAVLDDSASMLAHAPGEPSARDFAAAELERRGAAGGRGTRFTLIRSGPQPMLLGQRGMTGDEAAAALRAWEPRAPRHEFDAAWDEAAQVAEGSGRFLFLTDTVPDAVERLPQQLELIALGRPLENAAISAARWTFDSSSGRGLVYFRVSNMGSSPVEVSIVGRAQDAVIFETSIPAAAGTDQPLEFAVPGGIGQMSVDISSEGDGLATDNQVVLIEPSVRTVTVAVALPEDTTARGDVQRVLAALPDVQYGPVETAHLLIGPASALPESRDDLWWLGIGPVETEGTSPAAPVTLSGPYILDKQHPLLEGVTLDGVIWSGAEPLRTAVIPLATCDRMPLLAQLAGTDATAYVLNIDLPSSNLTRTPDWPILLANLVELRRNALPGLQRWNYRTLETVRLLSPMPREGAGDLLLYTPSGRSRPLIRDRREMVEIAGLDEPGVYEVREQGGATTLFAVNFFDPVESDLLTLSSGRRTPPERYEPTRLRVDDPYSWLIALAVLLVLGAILSNWFVMRGRSPAERGRI